MYFRLYEIDYGGFGGTIPTSHIPIAYFEASSLEEAQKLFPKYHIEQIVFEHPLQIQNNLLMKEDVLLARGRKIRNLNNNSLDWILFCHEFQVPFCE